MKDTKKAVRERNDTFREEFEKFLEVKFVNAPCNDETGCPGFMLNGSTVEVCDDCRNVTAVDKHGKVTSPRFPLTDEDAESFDENEVTVLEAISETAFALGHTFETDHG